MVDTSEAEEEYQLRPGLECIACHVLEHLLRLARSGADGHIGEHRGHNLASNPAWPGALAARVAGLAYERFVCFLPMALSATQDDKGRTLPSRIWCAGTGSSAAWRSSAR